VIFHSIRDIKELKLNGTEYEVPREIAEGM
jgi:hypothetical protein